MFLMVSATIVYSTNGKQNFDKSVFYAAMASENIDSINTQLDLVKKASFKNKEAFEGALLMKKAALVTNPGNKLNLFKSGHKKLENAIISDNKNAELRFLRIMIQEHAPKILDYRKQIDGDNELIHSGYKNLPPVVQKAVVDYCKKSKVLKPAFF
jgi:hypothetical protein